MNGEDKALATVVGDVETWLVAQKAQIALALPAFLTPERMMRVFLTEIRKTPSLLQCGRQSLMSCMMQAAQLGLEPGGVMGHMYFVPYSGEATPIIGYKGLIDLARRSGQIVSISARVVYSNDKFSYAYGLNEYLDHIPALEKRGEPIFTYAVAQLVGGGHAFEVMSVEQVNAIRNRAVSYVFAENNKKHNSVWHLHWDEMSRKTAIRRLFKYLPANVIPPEAREALYAEDTREFPESGNTESMMQMPSEKKPAAAPEPTAAPGPSPAAAAKPAAPPVDASAAPVSPDEQNVRAEFVSRCLTMLKAMNWNGWQSNAFATLVIGHSGRLDSFSTPHLEAMLEAYCALQNGDKSVKFTGKQEKGGNYKAEWVEDANPDVKKF